MKEKKQHKNSDELTEESFNRVFEQIKEYSKLKIASENEKTKYKIEGDFNVFNPNNHNTKVTRVLVLDSRYNCFSLGDSANGVVAYIDNIPYKFTLGYSFHMILTDSPYTPKEAQGLTWSSEPSLIGKTVEFKKIEN